MYQEKITLPKKIGIVTGLFIALFMTGLYTYGNFMNWFMPRIEGFTYTMNSLSGQFNSSILYAMTLALIPVAAVFTWHYASLSSPVKRVMSILIMLISAFVAAYARQQWLIATFTSYKLPEPIQQEIPFERLQITAYLFIGFLTGVLISCLLLKKRSKRKEPLEILHN